MKTKIKYLLGLAFICLPLLAFAQDAPTLPPELLSTNIRDWQLNGVTLILAITLIGRAYAALRKGGGLVGIWKGLVFGTNTPKDQDE